MTDLRRSGAQFFLTAAAVVIVLAGLKAATTIVVPVLLAAFISIIVSPAYLWLVRHRVPASVAVLLIVVTIAGLGAGLMTAVGTSIDQFTRRESDYSVRLSRKIDSLNQWLHELDLPLVHEKETPDDGGDPGESTGGGGAEPASVEPASVIDDAREHGPSNAGGEGAGNDAETAADASARSDAAAIDAPEGAAVESLPGASGAAPTRKEASPSVVGQLFRPGTFMRFIGTLLGSLQSMFTNAFLILLIIVFALLEGSSFPEKLHAVMPRSADYERIAEVVAAVRQYMALKTVISFVTGCLATLLVSALGIPFPFMWGLLAFLLNFIPNIGSLIAALPPVTLAILDQGLGIAIWTALGYFAINTVIGSIVEPRVMGRGFGLSPLVVFLSLIFWGWILGPVGMLLSVPLTMTVKIALNAADDTRWASVLLGSGAPPPRKTAG